MTVVIRSIRCLLGLIFMLAGIEKLLGLPDLIGPDYLVTELAKYHLKLFAEFIAYCQLIIGFLLLTNRFGTLGDVMVFPMLLNILVVTISLGWRGTPYLVGILLLLNMVLLISDWHKLKFLLTDDESVLRKIPVKRSNGKLDLIYVGLFLFILVGISCRNINGALARVAVIAGMLGFLAVWWGNVIRRWIRRRKALTSPPQTALKYFS